MYLKGENHPRERHIVSWADGGVNRKMAAISTPCAGCTRRSAGSDEEQLESARIEDFYFLVFSDLEEVPVSRDQEIGLGGNGAGEDEVVVRRSFFASG